MAEDVGELVRELSRRNPFVKGAVVLVFGMCWLPIVAVVLGTINRGDPADAMKIALWATVAVVGTAASFALARVRLGGYCLHVCKHGFVWRPGKRRERRIRWDSIRSVKDVGHGQLRILHLETATGPFELHAHVVGNDFADAILDGVPTALRSSRG